MRSAAVRVIDGSRTHVDDAARIWAEATAARDRDPEVASLESARPIIQGVLDRSPRSLLLVAVAGEEALGFAAVEPVGSTAEVSYVGVRPSAWGAGVGTALLRSLPSELTARGFTDAQLKVYVDNHRAIRLYEARGWRASGPPSPHPRTGKPEQPYRLPLTT
ncbi:GNAT family N-acetyltransferase [Saccharopolyspora antimicrobica]|uniref:GNAT family N-acetyltransferase n=1 Tax=Saccharopolyspora antimicrobica TaxID=455193 RepID=UPI00147704BB|nr:GNAT family N-acetyltransferase [Saccharopolyspora antimicrobica]